MMFWAAVTVDIYLEDAQKSFNCPIWKKISLYRKIRGYSDNLIKSLELERRHNVRSSSGRISDSISMYLNSHGKNAHISILVQR